MDVLSGGVRAPFTLGSHLRCYAYVLQIEKTGRELLARLARQAPLLPGADVLAFTEIDSTRKRVYGHKKEGARFDHTKSQGKSVLIRGLNALIAAVSTPLAASVIASTRLRGGNAPSSRGAASLAVQAIGTARACGATGTIVVRMDAAYYVVAVIVAVRRNGVRFSVTAPVSAAVTMILEDAWQPIKYPQVVFTGSSFELIQAEEQHCGHAVIEQFLADLNAQAFAALNASPGARAFYDELRARGIEHNDALRRLANRLVGILHGCLKTRTLYNEAIVWGHRKNLPQPSIAA